MTRTRFFVIVVFVGLCATVFSPVATADSTRSVASRRTLIIMLPGVNWEALDTASTHSPTLRHLLARSAVGDMAIKTAHDRNALGDEYTTFGAGTRATAAPIGELGYGVTEPVYGQTAGHIYQTATGLVPTGDLVDVTIKEAQALNAASAYNATLGAFGATLHAAAVQRTIISVSSVPGTELAARQAVATMEDQTGQVPSGRLAVSEQASLDQFDAAWRTAGPHVVVLAATPQATVSVSWLDHVLRSTHAHTDTVMLVSLVDQGLGIATLASPGVAPGLLTSASTGREGIVQLTDIAPTVLSRLSLAVPAPMEGQPFTVHEATSENRTIANAAARRTLLVHLDAAAQFRDSITPYVASLAASVAAMAILFAGLARPQSRRRLLVYAYLCGLTSLGVVTLSFIITPASWHSLGITAYMIVLSGASILYAVLLYILCRRNATISLLVSLTTLVVLIAADVVTGAHLQLNTALGYSATVAGRFRGIGNLAFAVLGCATVILAGLAWPKLDRRWILIGVMFVVVFVDGIPSMGADVGGVLTLVPVFLFTLTRLAGRRIRLTVVLITIATAGVLVIGFAWVDSLRDATQRSHLGRLFSQVTTQGLQPLHLVVERKANAVLTSFTSPLGLAMCVLLGGLAVLWHRRAGFLASLCHTAPETRAWVEGLWLLALLGSLVNDSGIVVAAIVTMIGLATLAVLAYMPVPMPRRELPPRR